MLASGTLDPMIEARITLDQVPDYLARLRKRAFDGKAVIRIGA
jgi:NADPH:quinone reductase-like Zn-dependent oxidoreductase